MSLCTPRETSLACCKCQDMCVKANEWKTWLQRAETPLIASWVHPVQPLIPLAGPLCWNGPFPAVSCPMRYVRLAEREAGHPVVCALDCLSFTRTATAEDRLWNPRNSHCLVSLFIARRSACVKDSVPFYVLPQCVTRSDERPIRLAKVYSFWPQIL